MIKYSVKNHACYDADLNYKNLPDDVVIITADEHLIFMGDSAPVGKRLVKNKYPFEFEDIPKKSNAEIVAENTISAKLILSAALAEDIESGGYTWQVRNQIDLQNIQDAIDQHEYDVLSDDETQSFRMSDNVWYDVTVAEFKQVLSDYRMRKKDIYAAFKAWTETDILEVFTI